MESDYRTARALGMTIRQFQSETLCSEYMWWIGLLNDETRRNEEAVKEAESKARGR